MTTNLLNCFPKVNQKLQLDIGLIPVLNEEGSLRTDDPDGQAGTRKGVSGHQAVGQAEVSPEIPHLILVEVLKWFNHMTPRKERKQRRTSHCNIAN